MKRLTIVAALALFSFLPATAEATPLQVSFAGIVPSSPGEPLYGMPVSGFFVYDDPFYGPDCWTGTARCLYGPVATVPVLELLLHVGRFSYTLIHAPGSSVIAPLGHNVWGPTIPIAAPFLPPGVLDMSICTMGAGVCFSANYRNGGSSYLDFGAINGLSITQVPEPRSLMLGLTFLTSLMVMHRRGRRGPDTSATSKT
jgi:hypothetical protein